MAPIGIRHPCSSVPWAAFLAVLGTGLASAQCSTAEGREAQGVRFAAPFAEH
jgi:hypothetical protein